MVAYDCYALLCVVQLDPLSRCRSSDSSLVLNLLPALANRTQVNDSCTHVITVCMVLALVAPAPFCVVCIACVHVQKLGSVCGIQVDRIQTVAIEAPVWRREAELKEKTNIMI